MMHHMLVTRCHNKLHLAPIGDHPQRILDIGCGTGIWTMEMGTFDLFDSHRLTSISCVANVHGVGVQATSIRLQPYEICFLVMLALW